MVKRTQQSLPLLKGTLDLLVLKTLSWQPMHGYGIAQLIRTRSEEVLQIGEGSLYPALQRLQAMGTHIPSSLLLMLPYGLTVAVLVFSSWLRGKTDEPAALGTNILPAE